MAFAGFGTFDARSPSGPSSGCSFCPIRPLETLVELVRRQADVIADLPDCHVGSGADHRQSVVSLLHCFQCSAMVGPHVCFLNMRMGLIVQAGQNRRSLKGGGRKSQRRRAAGRFEAMTSAVASTMT
jgi:hypothetical protein